MNTALVDMDQTLCDYEGAVKDKLEALFKYYEPNVRDIWFAEQFKPAVDLIKRVPGFWRTLPKIELGFKIVDILKEFDFDLHILTKGPYRTTGAWTEKVEWCREHLSGIPVTITENKGLVYGKILVDDWPIYCEAWLKWRPRGLVIMPAYEYNRAFELQNPGQVLRATGKNWDEIRAAIKRVSERKPNEELWRSSSE